jgi:hypothetical protein
VTGTVTQLRYRFGSLLLDSDVALPGFDHRHTDDTDGAARFRFRLRVTTEPAVADGAVVLGGPQRRMMVRRSPDGGYVLSAAQVAACTLSADRRSLWWHLAGGVPRAEDAEFLVATVLPRASTAQHTLVLHAAALAAPHGAVLLCGRSGAGKSTISSTVSARTGWPLLGDDAAAVEPGPDGIQVRGFNADVRTRAHPEPGAMKQRTAVADSGVDVRTGRLVIRLIPGAEPALRTPGPAERLITLRDNLLRLDRTDPHAAVREFTGLAEMTRGFTVVDLCHPCTPAALAATVDRVLELVEST